MPKEDYTIIVKDLKKRYNIVHNEELGSHTARDAISGIIKKPLKFLDSFTLKEKEELWALKGVSFKAKRGQVIGVMGRNGSGKSTLFKILSQVTSPTEGEAFINGTVGSLLEVGAGFHPELTGRENVYFNGAILGMSKATIDEIFSNIVDFSEIEKFIDTPVKFYSSGMKTRLAFSVAIHLDTDILLLDEVMAVGDYTFKQKCFAKMEHLAASGKTILFVSHLPFQIRRICNHGILLKDGEIIFSGDIEDTITQYVGSKEVDDEEEPESVVTTKEKIKRSRSADLPGLKLQDVDPEVSFDGGKTNIKILFAVGNNIEEKIEGVGATVIIKNSHGSVVANFNSAAQNQLYDFDRKSLGHCTLTAKNLNLEPGNYRVNVKLSTVNQSPATYDAQGGIVEFTVPVLGKKDSSEHKGQIVYEFSKDQ